MVHFCSSEFTMYYLHAVWFLFFLLIFNSSELKDQMSFICSSLSLCCLLTYFPLQNHWVNFNQTWHKASLGKSDSNLLKWKATLLITVRGDYGNIVKIHWQLLKTFFPRTLGQISTKKKAQSIPWWGSFKFVQIKGHTLS